MLTLGTLKNTSRPRKSVKRVGRGLGSGLGKTSGRGEKGAGSRSGYKRRYGYEGGQFRMFMKMPIRGFNNARFRTAYKGINLRQIESAFEDGEVVDMETLAQRGLINGRNVNVKILGNGELTKKVKINISAMSESAKLKLQNAKIPFNKPSNA